MANSPLELFRCWRSTTDAYAQWRRAARALQEQGQGHQGQHYELWAEGGHWRLSISDTTPPVVTARLLAAGIFPSHPEPSSGPDPCTGLASQD